MTAAFEKLTHEQQRQNLIRRATDGLAEIRQIHLDVDSWNDNAAQPGEAINPDPDGMLARLALYYETVLKQLGAPRG